MSNVWKRLQRVGKKAAKFNIKTYEHSLSIECSPKWQPNKVSIIFAHRDRRKSSKVCVCAYFVVVVLDTIFQLFFCFFKRQQNGNRKILKIFMKVLVFGVKMMLLILM